jgi:Tol biopolymer transport system component/DNA-binding winged helix-turn-helix (wHTH) protein
MPEAASSESGKIISLPTGAVCFGPFRFDPANVTLLRGDAHIRLPPRALGVLEYLVRRPGRLVSKEELLEAIWADAHVTEDSLTQAISQIRQALEDDARDPQYVETVPRLGYRFVADVTGASTKSVEPRRPRWRHALPWAVAAVAVISVFAVWAPWEGAETEQPTPTTTPITSLLGYEQHPALSPDGRHVAFIWDGGEGGHDHVWVQSISGVGGPQQRTFGESDDFDPGWSPEGDEIAFVRERAGEEENEIIREILRAPALGGPEILITAKTCFGWGLDWSPAGDYLAFSDCPTRDDPLGIFLLSMATGQTHQITFPPQDEMGMYVDEDPVFSPDGSMLAFARRRMGTGDPGKGHVFVLPLNGGEPIGEPRQLPTPRANLWDLDWTAEGDAIVYSTGRSGNSYLEIVSVDGGEPARLLVGEQARHLSVASQGSRLVYSRWLDDFNLWRVGGPTADAVGDPVKVFSSSGNEIVPVYSPRGDRVAFQSDRTGAYAIWVADTDGGRERQLVSGFASSHSPQWHPSGERIVLGGNRNPGDLTRMYVIEASGGFPQNLSSNEAANSEIAETFPSFSPDGEWIYFASTGEWWDIYRMPSDGEGPRERLIEWATVPRFHNGRIYFRRSYKTWSAAADGSDQRRLQDFNTDLMTWDVWRDQLFFARVIGPRTGTIEILDLVTNETRVHTHIDLDPSAAIDKYPSQYPFLGLTVSPDGQYIVFSRLDVAGSDLRLVDNYR